MGLVISGNSGRALAATQSLGSTQIGVSSAGASSNQAQGAAKGASGSTAGQINSQSNGATIGAINSNNAASQLVTLHTDVCDFNIIPRRDALLSSSGGFNSNVNGQMSAQGNASGVSRNLGLQNTTPSNSFSQASPVNNFPAQPPINPFAVNLSGSNSVSSNPGTTKVSGSTSGAQVAGQAGVQANTSRNHSIQQDGIVIYNPTGAIDPVTNTATGSADFLVFSDTKNNQQGAVNLGGQSSAQGTSAANNALRFGIQGPFNNYSYSTISVG